MNKCAECKIDFKRGTTKIGCGICGRWYHAECANMKPEIWELLSKEKQIHWYCKQCNNIAPEVLKALQTCIQGNIENKNSITELKEEIIEMREGKDETFNQVLKQLAKQVYEESKPEVKQIAQEVYAENIPEAPEQVLEPEIIRNIARSEVQENNDKKGREQNIVISNLEEQYDAETEVQNILTYLSVTVDVQGIRRMGREKKPGKHRPIWVKLSDKKERNAVLEKAKKLRRDETWKNVYINKDMTTAEVNEAYALRQELKARRLQEGAERGRSNLVISKGKIIDKREQPREPAQPRDGNPNQHHEENTDAAETGDSET